MYQVHVKMTPTCGICNFRIRKSWESRWLWHEHVVICQRAFTRCRLLYFLCVHKGTSPTCYYLHIAHYSRHPPRRPAHTLLFFVGVPPNQIRGHPKSSTLLQDKTHRQSNPSAEIGSSCCAVSTTQASEKQHYDRQDGSPHTDRRRSRSSHLVRVRELFYCFRLQVHMYWYTFSII